MYRALTIKQLTVLRHGAVLTYLARPTPWTDRVWICTVDGHCFPCSSQVWALRKRRLVRVVHSRTASSIIVPVISPRGSGNPFP